MGGLTGAAGGVAGGLGGAAGYAKSMGGGALGAVGKGLGGAWSGLKQKLGIGPRIYDVKSAEIPSGCVFYKYLAGKQKKSSATSECWVKDRKYWDKKIAIAKAAKDGDLSGKGEGRRGRQVRGKNCSKGKDRAFVVAGAAGKGGLVGGFGFDSK